MTQRQDDQSLPVRLTLGIQGLLIIALGVFLWRGDWENVFLTALVVALTLVPAFLRRQYRIFTPPDFQLASALFVFLTLFLGSAVDLYYKYWWWDMILHLGSGFLFGMAGFLAIFLLNQTERIPHGMKPGFVCLFAVTFATFIGLLWEIVEYGVDSLWPHVNMMSHESGVRDTMNDLIVDLVGAIVVAAFGWIYLRTGRYSFIADAVGGFVRRNPRLFRKAKKS